MLSSDAGVTPVSAIIAGLAFLNTLGIFGLIYHVGQYVGRNDQRWTEAEKRLSVLDAAMTVIHAQEITQAKLDAAIMGLKTIVEDSRRETKEEIQLLRRRSHELANVIQQVVLGQQFKPKPVESSEVI